jgi:hypothetical protein
MNSTLTIHIDDSEPAKRIPEPAGKAHRLLQDAKPAGRSHELYAEANAVQNGFTAAPGNAAEAVTDLLAALRGFTASAASLVQLIAFARLLAKAKRAVLTDTTTDGKREVSVTLHFGEQPDAASQFFILASAFATPDPQDPGPLAELLKKVDQL